MALGRSSLRSGERIVASSLVEFRPDHINRYRWALDRIDGSDVVIDCGCGVGYGSDLVAAKASKVYAFDNNNAAIDYAKANWSKNGAEFNVGNLNEIEFPPDATTAIAFEVIEHIADPKPFLRRLRKIGCRTLYASVPNEEVYKHGGPFSPVQFHERHYTRDEFEKLLNLSGWRVDEWWGQLDRLADVERDMNGRTVVVKASRIADEEFQIVPKPVLDVPRHVTIVALGPSSNGYLYHVKKYGSRHGYCDQVWGVNAAGSILDCDLAFHMDDVRVQEIRAAARPNGGIANMVRWLKTTKTPVMTSIAHPGYPSLIEFPLEDVVNKLGRLYFNNTGAYAIAYAVYIGVKELSLFGFDYTYSDYTIAEKGRGCAEYWLGVAAAQGITINMASDSSLLDSFVQRSPEDIYAYGYDMVRIASAFDDEAKRFKFTMTPREEPPTAEEIEAAYDHSRHPLQQSEAAIAAQ